MTPAFRRRTARVAIAVTATLAMTAATGGTAGAETRNAVADSARAGRTIKGDTSDYLVITLTDASVMSYE